ncbi:hypothetical protein Glove_441g7 [Diversispora epigaea]|uniref:Uncharacterized protein n=1 Tax=Diversispora epigaea TaxID=1348612 RepID=A0A397GV31_9GLOM|nr:hypothetical protein Glove_441g7 [Diversispora epigaea]
MLKVDQVFKTVFISLKRHPSLFIKSVALYMPNIYIIPELSIAPSPLIADLGGTASPQSSGLIEKEQKYKSTSNLSLSKDVEDSSLNEDDEDLPFCYRDEDLYLDENDEDYDKDSSSNEIMKYIFR